MKLTEMLSGYFTKSARSRGEQIYYSSGVGFEAASDTEVRATGNIPHPWDVDLRLDESALMAWCDCDSFLNNNFCKHVWATLLAAEFNGFLSAASKVQNLVLSCDDRFLDSWDDGFLQNGPDGPREVVFQIGAGGPSLPVMVPGRYVPQQPGWRQQIEGIFRQSTFDSAKEWPAKRQLIYVVNANQSYGRLTVELSTRDRRHDGSFTDPKPLSLKKEHIGALPEEQDRILLAMLSGMHSDMGWSYSSSWTQAPTTCGLTKEMAAIIVPKIVSTGRGYLSTGGHRGPFAGGPLVWDEAGPWTLRLKMRRGKEQGWVVTGELYRGDENMDLMAPALVQAGMVFTQGRVAPLSDSTPLEWLHHLRRVEFIEAPDKDRDMVLETLVCNYGMPPVDVPEELRYEEVPLRARPELRVNTPKAPGTRLQALLSFDYEGRHVAAHDERRGWYEAADRKLFLRDDTAEIAAAELLSSLGAKRLTYPGAQANWDVAPSKLPHVVRGLAGAGWHIEAEGKIFRRPASFQIEVASGIDWFELRGEAAYGGASVKLPELLAALRKGENMVQLGNGEYGILPEEWLSRFGAIAGLGTAENGHIRFRRSQAGLLDALLATQPEARCDETFARIRRELGAFQGVAAVEQPSGFVGQLREYQREGLGWMHFLRRFSFGGCLADDMGVGKTAQVLALLETRREARAAGEAHGPSLVVVPKSLVFNWKLEAARFTPQLRILDYTGAARNAVNFAACDLVLTTYGTLRRDVTALKDMEFDYVVLDEAQAVKNANTDGAKAVRLLRGQHRLAMSGTPMENHLGELWTLFEFLNPGMLGAASAFKLAGGPTRNPSQDTRGILAAALRPFILRRTKEQVARELPAKSEQVLYCEMEPQQRKLYDELLRHYRSSLLRRIDDEGLGKSKIQVLEALLRLRQAACHPGLLDHKRVSGPSAKLDMLLEKLREVLAEGHKALVFSQFTSLLAIVREHLDGENTVYEYLDGDTPAKERQRSVERFQNDQECRLFLLSLKAGGLGLNLTEAEYVFILDPWWNPAVEAQAVDRAHRIGQMRQVFAYRLITRDTVEEKVMQLQETKRDLAAAIISADNSLIRDLRREDLEILLS